MCLHYKIHFKLWTCSSCVNHIRHAHTVNIKCLNHFKHSLKPGFLYFTTEFWESSLSCRRVLNLYSTRDWFFVLTMLTHHITDWTDQSLNRHTNAQFIEKSQSFTYMNSLHVSAISQHPLADIITKDCKIGRVQLKRDGTRWCMGGEVKGKLANGVGSQSPSHRFTLPRNLVYPALLPLMRTPRLPAVDWTDTTADLNGLVHFAERPDLVSACVPSHFRRTLHKIYM